MGIRKTWLALPTFAVAGAVGVTSLDSWLGAQEPPPFGYYPSKVSPAQPGLVPAPAAATLPPKPVALTAAPPTAGPPGGDWNTAKPKLTSPVVAGPTPDTIQVPVRQVSGTRPATGDTGIRTAAGTEPLPVPPPPKIGGEPLTLPKMASEPVAAAPLAAPPAVTPPVMALPTAVPAPGPVGLPLTPPKISVESSIPEPKVPAAPPTPKPPAPPALSTAPVPTTPAPLAAVPNPAPTSFPLGNLTAKNTPTVVLEAIAPETVSVNQPLTYELVVKNTGAAGVANVRIDDELPAGAKFLMSEPAAEQNGSKLSWALGVLDAGAEKRIKVSVKPADEGEVRSRAVVSFSAAAEARTKVTRPKIALAMTAVETGRVGDEVTFTIKVTNSGTGTANKMAVQATLTDGLNHAQGNLIETELANLPAGESRVLTLRTLATKAGTQACTLSIVADGNAAETSKATVSLVEPMLAAKLTGPAKCLVRSEPEFKLELSNPGSATTEPVTAFASIPEGFEYVSASDAGQFNAGSRTVSWKVGTLSPNGKKEVTVKLRATAIGEGAVKVQAVASSAEVSETGVQQASARSTKALEAKAEGAIKAEGVSALRFEVVDVEDPVEVGKEAIYEIKVLNQGTAPCTNVQVVATLADGTSATGANGPTQARGQGQQVSFDAVESLATKQEAVFKIKVKGGVAGDQRFRVQVVCDQIKTPVVKEESTRFVKD